MRRILKKYLPDPSAIGDNPWLRPFRSSLLHPRLWHLNRHSAAGGVAIGLFCGLIPGPFQMLGAAIGALLFRCNLPLALFVTLYTNPLTIVPLYVLAYGIGRLATGDASGFVMPPAFVLADPAGWASALQTWMAAVAQPLGIGLLLLALGLAAGGYFAVRAIWRLYLLAAWHRRKTGAAHLRN